jgi:cytochrome c
MKKLGILFLACGLAAGLAAGLSAQDKKKSAAGDPAKGEAVFKEKNCSVCHWTDKEARRIGPGLKGLFKREKMWDEKPMTEANVRAMILKGGGKMTGFEDQLDAKAHELDNLIAYLKTL